MIKGIYTAAAGMLAATVGTDTLANNLANVNTIAYKAAKVNYQTFPEMLITRMGAGGNENVGSISTGDKVLGSYVQYTPGPMHTTGNTFDMALEGDGFFTIKTPAGQTYYTRAGNFTVNQDGYLTTLNGDFVQGELGKIQFNLDEAPITISREGTIKAKTREVDKLVITRFADNQALERVGESKFVATPASKILPPGNGAAPYAIHQGTLEESNVNPISELVNNIQGLRLYEALQKNIHIHNDTLGKAVNDVGRTR